MNILLFSGTKNGRELIPHLLYGNNTLYVSSASEYGASLLPESPNLIPLVGKLDQKDIELLIEEKCIDIVIDSTHPYAKEISLNILASCKKRNIESLRFERERGIPENIGKHFVTIADLCDYLNKKEGNILFTTGVKDLGEITAIVDSKRVYARVLPVESSIKDIDRGNIPHNQIVFQNPPFSFEDNLEHIKKFSIKYLVTKDSGKEGNIEEKIEAVNGTGIELLVLDRPDIKYNRIFYSRNNLLDYLATLGSRYGK